MQQPDYDFETVYTVEHYWDGPRSGVANFLGSPHWFEEIFDEATDDWTGLFLVQQIDDETLAMAIRAHDIFELWQDAFYARRTTQDTHPALPEDRQEYDLLQAQLDQRLRIDEPSARKVKAEFRVKEGVPIHRTSSTPPMVRWILI